MKTWEFILLVFTIVTISSMVYANTFTTATGKGYYSYNGQVISYYSFPANYTFNYSNEVTPTDTNGTNPVINFVAENAYDTCKNNGTC